MSLAADESPLKPFRHATPAFRTYFGDDSLQRLTDELKRANAERAAIFCGRTIAATPTVIERLKDALGQRFAGLFAGVKSHSPLPAVIDAATALREWKADTVIAVGGGSAVVTARAALILLAENQDIRHLCTQFPAGKPPVSPKLEAPKIPLFVVPTTPTTAYAKAGAAVVDPEIGKRLALFDPKARAQGIFIDPEIALTAPVDLTLDAALNAMASAIQGIEAKVRDPLADAALFHALRLFRDHLPRLESEPNDASLRTQLMLGALLAGQGTDFTGGGVTSVVGHCVGARFHLGNGVTNAILLPHAMRFNADATGARMEIIAELFGDVGKHDAAEVPFAAADAIAAFLKPFRIPKRLRNVGVSREVLRQIADDAMTDWFLRQNPKKIESADDLMPLLEAAW